MAIHLAARETFAVDMIPACKGRRGFLSETDGGFDATHTLTQIRSALKMVLGLKKTPAGIVTNG